MRMANTTRGRPEARLGLREGHRFPVRLTVQEGPAGLLTRIHGVSKDLTSGGMRVRISGQIPVGTRCRAQFAQCGGRVIPEVVDGTVRNAQPVNGSGREFEIGIQFDTPVRIKQPGKL